jgi:hypothetical protein
MFDLLPETTPLWLAVVASGVYHGVNPGMGWPLAVSAALMERRASAMPAALAALSFGHMIAMMAILLPFALMTVVVERQNQIRLAAGVVVVMFGLALLVRKGHPRVLARIPPSQLALWSFLVALAHGAALMLVPVYLGICGPQLTQDVQHTAFDLIAKSAGLTAAVAIAHTSAMLLAGGAIAICVYRWLGLRVLSSGWFNMEITWALSVVMVGAVAVYSAL